MLSDADRAMARRRRTIATSVLSLLLLGSSLLSVFFVSSFVDHITELKKPDLTADSLALRCSRRAKFAGRGPPFPQLVTGTESVLNFSQIWQSRRIGFTPYIFLLSSEEDSSSVYHRRPYCRPCSATSPFLKICSESGEFIYRSYPLECWDGLSSQLNRNWISSSAPLTELHFASDNHRRHTAFTPADLG